MLGFIKETPRVDFDKGVPLPLKEKEPPVGIGEIVALLSIAALLALAFLVRLWIYLPRGTL